MPGLRERIFSAIGGVVLPMVCFMAACSGMEITGEQLWQSDQFDTYIGVLFTWPTIAVFWPLVLFSMVALARFLWKPASAHEPLVRFGVTIGVVLSGQYLVLILLTTFFVTLFAAGVTLVPLSISVAVLNGVSTRARRFTLKHLMIATTFCALASLAVRLIGGLESLLQFAGGIGFLLIAATPTFTFLVYCRAAYVIARQHDFQSILGSPILLGGWLVAWGASWKLSVDLMLHEYAKLPTTNPNCYVSAAAAEGHAWFVGSQRSAKSSASTPVIVNRQMKQLKFLEFAIAAACPAGHRSLRTVYDRIGPSLANACRRHRAVADATFLMLTPLAVVAEAIRWRAGFSRRRIDQIYSANRERPAGGTIGKPR